MTVRDYQVEAVLAECYGHAGRAWAKLVMRYGGGSKPETRKEVEGVSRDHFFRVPPNVPQQIKDLIVQPTARFTTCCGREHPTAGRYLRRAAARRVGGARRGVSRRRLIVRGSSSTLSPPTHSLYSQRRSFFPTPFLPAVWDTEFTMPVVDMHKTSDGVSNSDGRISYYEKRPIEQVLKAVEGDATSNVKLRTLTSERSKLPYNMSRSQAEAVLRAIDVPYRRVEALSIIRDHLDSSCEAWAQEIASRRRRRCRSGNCAATRSSACSDK